jgi:hypothetical protein
VRRWLRVLFIAAPALLLLLGVPAGVALARRSPPAGPIVIAPGALGGTPVPGRPPQRPLPGGSPFIGPRPLYGPPLPVSSAQSGINGTITRVRADRLVIYTRSKKIAVASIDPQTMIRLRGKDVKIADIMTDDNVTVLGHRDSAGAFHAELIRVTRPERPDPLPGGAK